MGNVVGIDDGVSVGDAVGLKDGTSDGLGATCKAASAKQDDGMQVLLWWHAVGMPRYVGGRPQNGGCRKTAQ